MRFLLGGHWVDSICFSLPLLWRRNFRSIRSSIYWSFGSKIVYFVFDVIVKSSVESRIKSWDRLWFGHDGRCCRGRNERKMALNPRATWLCKWRHEMPQTWGMKNPWNCYSAENCNFWRAQNMYSLFWHAIKWDMLGPVHAITRDIHRHNGRINRPFHLLKTRTDDHNGYAMRRWLPRSQCGWNECWKRLTSALLKISWFYSKRQQMEQFNFYDGEVGKYFFHSSGSRMGWEDLGFPLGSLLSPRTHFEIFRCLQVRFVAVEVV